MTRSRVSVLVIPLHPRPLHGTLHWSEDGQLFFVTKRSIHVLTPQHTTRISQVDGYKEQSIRWSRSTIDLDVERCTPWILKDPGAQVIGSLDVFFKTIVSSPCGITLSGWYPGGVVAVLTSNLDLNLYSPPNNTVSGAWSMESHQPLIFTFLKPYHSPQLCSVNETLETSSTPDRFVKSQFCQISCSLVFLIHNFCS
ncbi:hypothetical protein DL96DRAFT_1583580 [Flagelloscypha sp. PMI_526]|nr:hypothetical protein DL96DRAFT_1583580 [Flagelloscypha sp. PMI_526]